MNKEQRKHALVLLEIYEFYMLIHDNYHKGLFKDDCLTCWQLKTDNFINKITKLIDEKLFGEDKV